MQRCKNKRSDQKSNFSLLSPSRASPFQVKLEVAQDSSAGQEGAAHAGQEMPVGSVGGTVGVRDVIGLFDQLTVNFIS